MHGFKVVPDYCCKYITIPLTNKEKKKIFITKFKKIVIEVLWLLLLIVGITLQVSSILYLSAIFLKYVPK